jgi:hypothetical protein
MRLANYPLIADARDKYQITTTWPEFASLLRNPAPEARREVSPARKRWVKVKERPERRRRDTSSENVAWIIFNAVLLQQCDEFLFKCHFTVVPVMILNVSHDHRDVRLAYPEPAVPLLPHEPADLTGHPPRRVRLNFIDRIGNRKGGWKLQQHMNVVCHAMAWTKTFWRWQMPAVYAYRRSFICVGMIFRRSFVLKTICIAF